MQKGKGGGAASVMAGLCFQLRIYLVLRVPLWVEAGTKVLIPPYSSHPLVMNPAGCITPALATS